MSSIKIGFNDFNIFGPVKKDHSGKRFSTDTNVKQAVISLLETRNTHLSYVAIQHLVLR